MEIGKDKENRRHSGGGHGEGISGHLTVMYDFLMRALVLCIPILRSLQHAEPGKQMQMERKDEKVKG